MTSNQTVLIVEDDAIIAMELEDTLLEQGWDVVGPAPSVEQAVKLLEKTLPQIALLDYNLKSEETENLARRLLDLSIPVVFLSGDTNSISTDEFGSCSVLTKPINMHEVHSALVEGVNSIETKPKPID